MKKIILILAILFCIPSSIHAYEKIGGESFVEWQMRKNAIEDISKQNAKYIYERIVWYQQFETYEDRTMAVWYMYQEVIPKLLEDLEKKKNGTSSNIK